MLAIQSPYSPWIHLAGDHERGGGWHIVQRVLPYYLLVVSYDGGEELTVGGKYFEIPKNGAYLIQPGVLAERIGSRKGNRPCFVHFDVIYNERRSEQKDATSFDDLKGREHLLQPGAKAVWGVDLPVRVPKPLESTFARVLQPLVRRWVTTHPHDQLIANHELQGLLHTWVQHETPRDPDVNLWLSPETRVRRAENAARLSLARLFGVEEFAAAAGLGRAQFTRVYREVRGISPGQALRDMRIGEAELLLRTTALSVQEIGKSVGYPNATVLARCFRERHGVSPSEWRAKHAK